MQLPASRDEILILHNPNCSKSRATLALLEESGVEFRKRLYLEHPLDRKELAELGRRLGKAMLAFTRTKQSEFAEAGLTLDSPESAVLDAVVATPILSARSSFAAIAPPSVGPRKRCWRFSRTSPSRWRGAGLPGRGVGSAPSCPSSCRRVGWR